MPIPRDVLEELYRSMSDEEIAKQYGYSPKYVGKLRLIYGLYRRKWSRCPEIPREVLEELYRTMRDNEIAKIYGVSADCIKMLRRRYGLSRKRGVCPEISRDELVRLYLLKSDQEIAKIYGTTPSCIHSIRKRYGLFATQSSQLLSDIERLIAENCYIRFTPRPRWMEVLAVLSKKGYKVVTISYVDVKFRHIIPKEVKGYIVYRQGCEKAVATHIASLIARHANQQTPRTQIIAAVIDLIWRNKFPKEDKGLIRDLIIDMLHEPTAVGAS
jgi:uncharacterized protein (DUF433 family)